MSDRKIMAVVFVQHEQTLGLQSYTSHLRLLFGHLQIAADNTVLLFQQIVQRNDNPTDCITLQKRILFFNKGLTI